MNIIKNDSPIIVGGVSYNYVVSFDDIKILTSHYTWIKDNCSDSFICGITHVFFEKEHDAVATLMRFNE